MINIGRLILSCAKDSADEWEYAGIVYSTSDGSNIIWKPFLYTNSERIKLTIRNFYDEIELHFKHRRGEFQMHFEFDDINRLGINPGNAKKAYDILVKDVFSKA